MFVTPAAWLAALLVNDARRPFWLGFVLGVTAYGLMLSWVTEPAGWLAWVLLVAIQAAFIGLASVLVRPWLRHPAMPLIAALAWTGADLVRAWAPLKGFEWGALQYAHVDGSPFLPLARLLGGRSVTLVTVFLAAAAVHLVVESLRRGDADLTGPRRIGNGLPAARVPALFLIGGLPLSTVVTVGAPPASGAVVDVLVVQGNDLETTDLSAAEEDRAVATNLMSLTREALGDGPVPDLVVWPENAFDRDPWEPEGADLAPIAVEAGRLTAGRLLAGVNRIGPRDRTFENSQVHIGANGEVVDVYVKQQYVPFGEYVPWRSVLGDFPPLRQVPRDGIPVAVADVIRIGESRIAVGICFESLFGRILRNNIRAGEQDANLLVISTSDSTFGRTGEPEQHLSQSRMRAVESGRWTIHATSSGVTTLIAPDGSVGERTDLFTQATQRHQIPLVDQPTPWLRWGDVLNIPLGLGVVWLLVTVIRRRRARGPAEPAG